MERLVQTVETNAVCIVYLLVHVIQRMDFALVVVHLVIWEISATTVSVNRVFFKNFLYVYCTSANKVYSSTTKHAREAALEGIVLSTAPQIVRMMRVTMLTERVPVNLDGKGSTAAKVTMDFCFLSQMS